MLSGPLGRHGSASIGQIDPSSVRTFGSTQGEYQMVFKSVIADGASHNEHPSSTCIMMRRS